MAKSLDHKCKQCRREGVKLFLKGERCFTTKCPIVRRNYPPGVHGVKGRPRQTVYGVQLRAKQRAKRFYGLLERQFHLYYEEAMRRKGETAENLLHLLESRLDNFLCRAGFSVSRGLARQLVGHGHVLVNGKKVTIPSYILTSGDVVEIHPASQKNPHFQKVRAALPEYDVPSWISLDPETMKAKYLQCPTIEQVAPLFDLKHIVEFYSR